MFNAPRKLSTQLSFDIMLMAVPIFILSLGMLFKQSGILVHQKVEECSHSILNTEVQRVRVFMGTIETAANSNVWMLEENFRPDSLQSVSNRIVRLNTPVISSSVFVVPDMFKEYGHGFSLYTVNQGGTVKTYCEPEYNYFDKACYTQPVNSGNACWVDPFVDNAEGEVDHNEAIATYCLPIRKDGNIVGVLTTDLSFSRMAKMLNENNRPYPHAYYMLLGGDGRYLIHPDATRLFRKTIFTDADPGRDKDMITLGYEMTAGKRGTVHLHLNGERYHVSYQPIPGTNWSLALVCPDAEAMKSYYQLGFVIIVLLVIGLIVMLLLCNRVVKRSITPLYKLSEITQKITDGQYDETVPVTTQRGIFGHLQNSFAHMQQTLKERMDDMRQHAAETRRHNEELNKKKQLVEEAVEKKNQFIYKTTHQIRIPLNVVAGFSDVLAESRVDEEMIDEGELNNIKEMLNSNVIMINRMVLMLFDASETDATGKLLCQKQDEVSCNNISHEVIDHVLRHFPQADIQFETELHDAIHILTNRVFLLCVLIEPLYNAVNHSDGKHILLRVSQTAETVVFTIQDVGPGLPADFPGLKHKPFTELDKLSIGVGIGLSLAKRHAIGLGGNLTIDPDYHEGCRIVIEMPK